MSNTVDYLIEYGNKSFEEHPFCAADAVVMCEAFYMPLESVISPSFDDEPVNFAEGCSALFEQMGKKKYKRLGLGISPGTNKNLERMSQMDRYSGLSFIACREAYGVRPALQYAVTTVILPDSTHVVVFRGTDDTLAGWKEDADIFLRKQIPSYRLALDYLTELAEKREGDIIICGHSKGGNVALWAALNSDEGVRNRIKGVYNFDGPGFWDYSLFRTPEYEQLLPYYGHFVPYSSFVGMLLAHDSDYTPILSSKRLGPLQHNLGSWQIENGQLVTLPDIDKLAKITDTFSADFMGTVSEAGKEAVDLVLDKVMEGIVYPTQTEAVKHICSGVSGASKAVRELEPAVIEEFKGAFSSAGETFKAAVKKVTEASARKAAAKINPAQ